MGSSRGSHFLCSIGTSDYPPTTYTLNDRQHTTRFAPVATAVLLELKGARASVLVPREAQERWYQPLAAELEHAGLEVEPVVVQPVENESQLLAVVHTLIGCIAEGERVVLDVTFSLRHLPFVYFTALTYLVVYRSVEIGGLYYGASEITLRDGAGAPISPIIDLTPLFSLVRWYHAVQAARESGWLVTLVRQLNEELGRLFQRQQPHLDLTRVKNPLRTLADALASGLPLEAGLAAQQVSDQLRQLERRTPAGMAELSVDHLKDWIEDWVLSVSPHHSSLEAAKRRIALNEDELRRQLRLVRWYLERGDLPKGLLLLREWLVSFVLLRGGNAAHWLQQEQRKHALRLLRGWAVRADPNVAPPLGPVEQRVGSLWQQLSKKRNLIAHAGMTTQWVSLSKDELANLVRKCEDVLERSSGWSPALPPVSTLLVTPLGLSPGVLYSALKLLQPASLMVVTSATAAPRLEEAIEQAGAKDLPLLVRQLDDPYFGFRQVDQLIDPEVDRALINARQVVLNLTGGTTVLQYAVERIGRRAQQLGLPLRKVALVDRRPLAEQQAHPYVVGDAIELEAEDPPGE
ncbi:MAG: hypothetical protein KatS3mg061_0704 [Dehalococcoidia bacterium]|nr:MAG: hypothetical protein KatS3mg061_0704 [Dehalococcoidia bacterium]